MRIDQKREILQIVRGHGADARERAERSAQPSIQEASAAVDAFHPGPMGVAFAKGAPAIGDWRTSLRDRYRSELAQGKNPFYSPAQGATDAWTHASRSTALVFVDELLRPIVKSLADPIGDLVSAAIGQKDGEGIWPYGEASLGSRVYPSAITIDVSEPFENIERYRGGDRLMRALHAPFGSETRRAAELTLAIELSDMLGELGLALVDFEVEPRGQSVGCRVVVRDLQMLALALALDPTVTPRDPKAMLPIDDVGMERLHLEETSKRLGQRTHYEQ